MAAAASLVLVICRHFGGYRAKERLVPRLGPVLFVTGSRPAKAMGTKGHALPPPPLGIRRFPIGVYNLCPACLEIGGRRPGAAS